MFQHRRFPACACAAACRSSCAAACDGGRGASGGGGGGAFDVVVEALDDVAGGGFFEVGGFEAVDLVFEGSHVFVQQAFLLERFAEVAF